MMNDGKTSKDLMDELYILKPAAGMIVDTLLDRNSEE